MAVTEDKLSTAIMEAERFISVAKSARERLRNDSGAKYGCKETGAVRRASMDLTNTLVDIRN